MKALPYAEDHCPICSGSVVSACRCWLNDRRCAQGHIWRRDILGNGLMLSGPHGDVVNIIPPKDRPKPTQADYEWAVQVIDEWEAERKG